MTQKIIEEGAINSLLFPDLSSDHSSAVYVEKRNKLTKSIHHATLPKDFSISSELYAWTEIGEKTYNGG